MRMSVDPLAWIERRGGDRVACIRSHTLVHCSSPLLALVVIKKASTCESAYENQHTFASICITSTALGTRWFGFCIMR